MSAILKLQNVSYTYKSRYQSVEAVHDVSCSFEEGTVYAIMGLPGAAKPHS